MMMVTIDDADNLHSVGALDHYTPGPRTHAYLAAGVFFKWTKQSQGELLRQNSGWVHMSRGVLTSFPPRRHVEIVARPVLARVEG